MADGPHWVKIRLLHLTNKQTGEQYPYKWKGECICGWCCISWSWSREWYFDYNPDQLVIHIAEGGGRTTGGALAMTLEHLGLYISSTT